MTYGLRVINDDSELLIDSNFTNPAFVQKIEFSGTPTSETIEPVRGFQKRIHTATIPNPGNYIVMWTLPENPGYNDGTVGANGYYKMLYYYFPTSTTVTSNLTLSITVFVYGAASAFTYKLPTAYLFAVTDLPSNGSHGLRLFNDSGQKTFDSNNIQLVPTAISENFQFWDQPTLSIVNLPAAAGTTMDLSTSGTDPIFFLPNYYQYKVAQVPPNFNTWSGSIYVPAFYRFGNYVRVTDFVENTTSGTGMFPGGDENRDTFYGPVALSWEYISGNRSSMAIVAANSSLYATPNPGTATGTSPNFTLSVFSDPFPAQEGGTITVQISTTNVPNGTAYGYTVTGISAADLSAGSLTGTLVINQNVGTVNFTLANDNLTEGTETFVYTIQNTPYSVTMDITDTSQTQSYSWSTPASINEGSSGSLSFNFSGALNKSVAFSVIYGTNVNSSDVTLNTTSYTIPSNSAGSTAVSYSVAADATTEGTEYFQLRATVNGVNYDSNSITINDTSTTPPPIVGISANSPPWSENSTRATNISLSNVNGFVYYPTSDNANVICQTPSFTVTGSTYTTILYWTVGSVTADTTVNLYLRRGSASGTIDAQTSVLVKDIPVAGTPIGSAFCVNSGGAFTLRQVRADGAGGTYNDDTLNSPTCGYVAPTYSLSASPTTVNEGASFVITLTTNQSGSFPYTITGVSSADIGSTSLTGSLSNGGTRTISVTADAFTEGTEYFVVTLDNGQANVTVTINDTSKNVTSVQRNTFTGPLNSAYNTYNSVSFLHNVGGAISPSQWSYTGSIPPGMSFTQEGNPFGNYYNSYTLAGTSASPGNYTFTVYATNSGGDSAQATFTYTVNSPVYPAAGTTSGGQYCSGTTLYQNYHDGSGGVYASVVAYNSPSCGYVAPAYTLYGAPTSINNNTSYTSFYVRSTNANGVTITPSLSGAGAARCSVSPTSRTISGNGTVDSYFTITTTLPTATIAEQSVTLSVAGLSFTFTIPAYTVSTSTAPTVTSISMSDISYYSEDTITGFINFSGPITADTYVNVRFSWGTISYLPNNSPTQGASPPGAYGYFGEDLTLTVGATSASFSFGPVNPYNDQFNNRVSAKTVTAATGGSDRQVYVVGPAFTILGSGGGGFNPN